MDKKDKLTCLIEFTKFSNAVFRAETFISISYTRVDDAFSTILASQIFF